MNSDKNVIHSYVRNRKGHPVGIVVALRKGDQVLTGWSLCNVKAGDLYNKEHGFDVALVRAQNALSIKERVPHSVQKQLKNMRTRAPLYFKGIPADKIV